MQEEEQKKSDEEKIPNKVDEYDEIPYFCISCRKKMS